MAATAQYTLRFAFKLLSPILKYSFGRTAGAPLTFSAARRRAHATRLSAGGTPTPNFHVSRSLSSGLIGSAHRIKSWPPLGVQHRLIRWAIATHVGLSRNEQRRHIDCMDAPDSLPSAVYARQVRQIRLTSKRGRLR